MELAPANGIKSDGNARRSGNFAYLFAAVLLTLLALPAADVAGLARYSVILLFDLFMLVGVWSLSASSLAFRFGMALVLAISVVVGASVFSSNRILEPIGLSLILVFLSLSGCIAARNVFVLHRADLNSLVGAFSVYLLLGLNWAVLYRLLHLAGFAAFSGNHHAEGPPFFAELVYFSFVTLASLGYGDITPVGDLVRTLAYLEAVVGQFYLAVLVASLVGAFTSRRIRE